MDGYEPSGITVTVKYGKEYDAQWAVFRAGDIHNVKCQIVDYFGWEESQLELTLHELVCNAKQAAKNTGGMGDTLGAVAIRDGGLTNAPSLDEAVANPSLIQPEGKASVSPNADLINMLENAGSTDELKGLWAKFKDKFSDPDVKAAYSKRGKALSGK